MSMTYTTRIPRELRDPDKLDHDHHGSRLFEIAKEARFAADPARTAHALAQIAMWLDGGASSNVHLSAAERAEILGALELAERAAYAFLPADFTRRDIALMFETWRAQAERWSRAPAERPRDAGADNLRDVARVWRNQLHNVVLIQDVHSRLGRARRMTATLHDLLHLPAPSGPEARAN